MERYSNEEFSYGWIEDVVVFIVLIALCSALMYGAIKLANKFGFLLWVLP